MKSVLTYVRKRCWRVYPGGRGAILDQETSRVVGPRGGMLSEKPGLSLGQWRASPTCPIEAVRPIFPTYSDYCV